MGPSSPPQKGHAPNFWPLSIVAKRWPISASADCWALVSQLKLECPYTLQWAAPFPLRIAHSHVDPIWKYMGSLSPSRPKIVCLFWFMLFCLFFLLIIVLLLSFLLRRIKLNIYNPNGISISSAVFAGLATVTDRQTDRQTTLFGR